MVGRSPGVGRGSCDSAVRYQITDTRPLFQRSLSRLLSLTALEAPACVQRWLARISRLLAVSSSANLSVSVLLWLTLIQSSRKQQEGRRMVLLSVSGGRPTQDRARCCCCNWLIHSPPSRSPHAVFLCKHCAAAVTLDTQNAVLPPAEWCKLSLA